MHFLFCSKILDPGALLDYVIANDTFEDICGVAQGVDHHNGKRCKTAEEEGNGNAQRPHRATVKQEGDHGLAACAHGKVDWENIGLQGHGGCGDDDQPHGKLSDGVGGVVDHGEDGRKRDRRSAKDNA